MTMRPPHFDVHQSATANNIGSQGCMFDNLIRRDPRDSGRTIIPDLAHSWEIAKGGRTCAFFLRKGVEFHDGADLTADDVKTTFDRIAKPPPGISTPRYQPDTAAAIKEARALMTASGHSDGLEDVDFLVRDAIVFEDWAQAIKAMLAEELNIHCNLRVASPSVWFGDAANGDLSIGVIVSTLLDPSDYFNTWYPKRRSTELQLLAEREIRRSGRSH